MREANMGMQQAQVLGAESLGAAWVGIARSILQDGISATYDGLPILELSSVVLDINSPDPEDGFIARHADPERLAWMKANFTSTARVAALGDADSYATRFYDYQHSGHNQIAWVVERLRSDPRTRSATITTFQPLTDTSYIPCISLLDFWIPAGALELLVYAHSIDFGTKGYGNLVELSALQKEVAIAVEVPIGRMVMMIKSAHIYRTEMEYMQEVVAAYRPDGQ
jgi:thymidylate synthase